MSSGTTPILGLHTYGTLDDLDLNEVTADNNRLDGLPPLVCTSSTRPTGSERWQGRLIWQTDISVLAMWDGNTTSWIDVASPGVWTSFTPTLHTDAGGAATVVAGTSQQGKYKLIGKTCHAWASGTFTGATASGAGISLPFTAKDRLVNCGTLAVSGSGTPADQSGIAYMTADKTKLVPVAYSNGFRDAAAGNSIRYSVTYEIA